jgi:hypothetical protein
LNCILKKWDGPVWIGLMWLRVRTSGGSLVNIVTNHWFSQNVGISKVAEDYTYWLLKNDGSMQLCS